jgi:glycosyltransferase involved in cell wall biosynthesis
MITALIETMNDEVALAHTLAALVPAATEGVLREVIVIDHGSTDGTLVVADAAGCNLVVAAKVAGDPRRFAAERARGNWLLLLPPTAVLRPGWQGEAMAFVDRALVAGRGMTAVGRFDGGRLVPGWWASLTGRWRRLVGAPPRGGVLMSKDAWLAFTASSPASSAWSASGVRRGAA